MSAQLIDHVSPGGHDRLDLVGITAVARLLWMVGKIPTAWCANPFATFVGNYWNIKALVLCRVAEDVHSRLLTGKHQVDLLQKHLTEENNASVALTELFEVSLGDVALRHPAHVILVKSDGEVGELALGVCQRHDAGRYDILRRCCFTGGCPPGIERDVERVCVVRRHAELQRAADPEDIGKEDRVPKPPLRV